MTGIKRALVGFVAAAAILTPARAATAAPAADGAPSAVFAVVDGSVISTEEFEGALTVAVRQKFYHRRPPDDQLAALRSEIADRIVNHALLLKEARRRGIHSDAEKVSAEVATYEQRYRDSPQWRASRAQVLPGLTRALEERNVIAQLETATRAGPPPSEADLRAYYELNPKLFTEPEKLRPSMILIKVDPSSPAAAWEQAQEQAQDIVVHLANGADFAELARLNSGDSSARDGGDMGYRHRGTLPEGIESEIDKLVVGATSEPIRLLEGIAIFRLAARKPAQLRAMEDVRGNIAELWAREKGEMQWRALSARLRANAEIRISGDLRPGPAVIGGSAGDHATH